MSKGKKTGGTPVEHQKFFRIVELELSPGESYRGYQGEEIEVEGDQVVTRTLIDKPNLFEYAQTHVVDLMDPRNKFVPPEY